MLLLFSCKQTRDTRGTNQENVTPSNKDEIVITVTGDNGVTIADDGKVTAKKGNTWKAHVQPEVMKKFSCKKGFEPKIFHLNDVNGAQLTDEQVFNENATIFVETQKEKWTKVKYSELDAYLKNEAKADELNYIHVIELEAEHIIGEKGMPPQASPLAKILTANATKVKQIAIKFDENIEGATSMFQAFAMCTNLVYVENIPNGITTMEGCFYYCGALTHAPTLPEGLTNMKNCFGFCTALESSSKIPSTLKDMEGCFLNCQALKTAPVLPEGLTVLANAFMQTGITEMPKIPSTVTNMMFAFCACPSLAKTTTIPASIKDFRSAFLACKKITSVELECPYNKEKGGENDREGYSFEMAFGECEGLQAGSIKVPNAYLADYQNGATNMMVASDRFVGK